MITRCLMVAFLCFGFGAQAQAEVQDIDKELVALAEKLATPINEASKKKVTVIDFTDLQGNPCGELGRYIAEQVSLNLVMTKRDFAVLDRANLKSILAEHKLTALGLVDPENAKKLGTLAGVDTLVLGTMVHKGKNIALTAKIITTDTAEVIGGTRGEFKIDDVVEQLESRQMTNTVITTAPMSPQSETAKATKTFGDLRVELLSLKIVNEREYRLTMNISNLSAKKIVWVALHKADGTWALSGSLTDPDNYEFLLRSHLDRLHRVRLLASWGAKD